MPNMTPNINSDINPDVIDVLILCALKEEYNQILNVKDGLIPPGWETITSSRSRIIAKASFSNSTKKPLTVYATWAGNMGREQAMAVLSSLSESHTFRCIAMSGVCGGRRGKVALGDVIFANRLWSYDAGKTIEENGNVKFEGDTLQYHPSELWQQRMQNLNVSSKSWPISRAKFPLENQENWVLSKLLDNEVPYQQNDFEDKCPDWTKVLKRLWKKGFINKPLDLSAAGRDHILELVLLYPKELPLPADFKVHVAPIATGAAVVEDESIFEKLSSSMRYVLGIDMEASALATFGDIHEIPVIVAKAVSDFGDTYKDNRYRDFAAHASAQCLIKLLRESSDLLPIHASSVQIGREDKELDQIPSITDMWQKFGLPKKEVNYQARGKLEDKLTKTLLGGKSIVIAGFGGLGKSSICYYLANNLKDEFDIALKIDGAKINSLNELGSCDVLSNGYSQNVLGLLKKHKCILVLDNLAAAILVKDLDDLCSNGSVILASRRDVFEPNYITLPLLSRSVSRKVLEFGVDVQCPEKIFDKIYAIVGGYPLIYGLMNANVINKRCGWGALELDCEVISEYKDNKNQKLTERLIGHLVVPFKTQLSFLKACSSKSIDLTFAKSVLKSIGILDLEDSTILSNSNHNILKMHDIIFDAINHMDSIVPMDITASMESLLLKQKSDDWDGFLRTSYRHLALIKSLLEKTGNNIFLYAYVKASTLDDIDGALVPDPERLLETIQPNNSKEAELVILIITQLIENEYLSIKDEDSELAQQSLKQRLPILKSLLDMFMGLVVESRIRHHYAKALKRLKDVAAEQEFLKLSQLEKPMREAQLQLARIYASSSRESEAKELIKQIMDSRKTDNSASIPIMLSSFEIVTWKSMGKYKAEFNSKYSLTISDLITESMAFGYDYAYLAFASFASDWAYNLPEKFMKTFKYLPIPTVDSISEDDLRNSIGDLYREAGKIERLNKATNYKDLLRLAIQFYDSTVKKSNYYRLRLAEAKHLLGDDKSAEEICNELVQAEYRSPQKYYWLAKAQLQSKPDIALKSVELALDDLKGQFRTASLELKSDILRSLEDSDYLTPLVEAIELCSSEKYKAQLERKYFELKGERYEANKKADLL